MKNLITIILFIFVANLSFGQIPIRKAGNFYELNDLWKRDSVSVKQLINKFDLKISKLDTIQFFKQFDLNKKLHNEHTYTTYIYILNKQTNTVTMKSLVYEGVKPRLNKYIMIFCFDDYTDKKIINIKVF